MTIQNFNLLYIENDYISFSIENIKNPVASILTESFQFSVVDSYGNACEQQNDQIQYSVIPAFMNNLTITPQMSPAENLTDLTISFTKIDILNSVGMVL